MGLNFRKSTKILPGVRLNASKSGMSISFGGRGSRVTYSKRGVTTSVGIPGTGIYYRKFHSNSTRGKKTSAPAYRYSGNASVSTDASTGSLVFFAIITIIAFILCMMALFSKSMPFWSIFFIVPIYFILILISSKIEESNKNAGTAGSQQSLSAPYRTPSQLAEFAKELEHLCQEYELWNEQMAKQTSLQCLNIASQHVYDFLQWSFLKKAEGYPVKMNMTMQEAFSQFNKVYNENLILVAQHIKAENPADLKNKLQELIAAVKPHDNLQDTINSINSLINEQQ